MIKHVLVAAVLAGCSLTATGAYAGSPYNVDPAAPPRPTASHALGTGHVGGAWANSGYAATANEDSFGAGTAPARAAAPATVANPQSSLQTVPQYFYHAEGTMGAR